MKISGRKHKYIYGPLYSWRMGTSLGIDPVTAKGKICNFDCVYCQLGRTAKFSTQRKEFVSASSLMAEINSLPPMRIDYYTFSGRGEPTLARNLGKMILALRAHGKGKVAVITNAALIDHKDVRQDLALADFVLVKLDACDQKTLTQVDVPTAGIDFKKIIEGIKAFRKEFSGKLALQVMFIEQNKRHAAAIARIAREIKADEVQINTPLRPCAVKPLGREEMDGIKKYFKRLPVVSVYDTERKNIRPLDDQETIRRHGNYRKKCN